MKALLDTHSFLWWNMGDKQLSPVAYEFISDSRNEIYLSAASAWEIAIKTARARLTLPQPPNEYVASRMSAFHFLPLPIWISHALHVFKLPEIHQDPFDRMLIAQSQLENIPLLTSDLIIREYDVQVIW